MALADYWLCDICAAKTFYDANLNYDYDTPDEINYRHDMRQLPSNVGDMAAICKLCAKKYRIVIVPLLNETQK